MSTSRYVVAAAALRDLDEIREYLERQSDDAWPAVSRRLESAFKRLAESPGIGHQRNDVADPRYRVWVVVVYTHATRPVGIARLFHGARDAGRVMRGR